MSHYQSPGQGLLFQVRTGARFLQGFAHPSFQVLRRYDLGKGSPEQVLMCCASYRRKITGLHSNAMADEGGKKKLPQDFIAEIGVDDLYDFLGIDSSCSEKEVLLNCAGFGIVSLSIVGFV